MKGSEQEEFLKEQCDLFACVPLNLMERFKESHRRSSSPEMEGKIYLGKVGVSPFLYLSK